MKKKVIESYFRELKVTQMGLGGFGRALEEAKFLLKYGADLIITDSKNERELEKEIKDIKEYGRKIGNIPKIYLGKQQKKDYFINRDLVLYPNGARLDNEFIRVALENRVMVTKSAALLF